ncbi:carbohydrate-binding protein [Streptomyces sp. NPDC051217]|uniref:carbohydrate-binding protein n=1 Tax=Streptomyces sp. NPDC051217 TaxID=3365644 RepID=UPI003788A827
MTAGNNGASTPEDDDPFGYLYEDGQTAANGAQARRGGYGYPGPASQPGVPRTSYNQVRTVGERQYGQVPQQGPYGQQPQYGGQQQYGQQAPNGQAPYGQSPYGQSPDAHYAAPETGGAQTRTVPAQRGRGSGGGPNTKGLLIGAVAVVAVVVIGITAALLSNGDDSKNADGGPTEAPTTGESAAPSEDPGKQEPGDKPVELPKQDAATLKLGAPAVLARDIPGAKGADGAYVTFNGPGGSASWTVDLPEAGPYTLFITYGVPGKDAKTSLTINDEKPRSVNMSNFAKAKEGDWEKGWTTTYAYVNLDKGSNTLKLSCEAGDQCEAILDQVSLEQGQTKG